MTSPWAKDFPTTWHKVRLKNLVDHVRNGTWGDEPDDSESGVVCVRAADFDRVRNRVSRTKLVRRMLTSAELTKHRLEPGDLVLEKSGGGEQQPVGAAVLFDLNVQAVTTNFAARVRPATGVDPRFLTYLLASTYHLGINQRAIKQTTGLQNLDADAFFNEIWAVPSHSEQRAIADFLDRETARIDALIAKKRRLVGLLRARFLEKARRLLTDGLQITDPLDVRETNMGSTTLREVVRFAWDFTFGSGTTPPAGDERYYGRGVPWLITGDLTDWKVPSVSRSVTQEGLESYSALKVHPAGSLVIAMYGATVGRLGLVDFEFATNQACCVLHSGKRIDVQFAFYWLLSHREALHLRGVGAGQPNISQEMIRSIRIAAPPRNEQLRLVKVLDGYRRRTETGIDSLTRQIALFTEHRQALITAAVTGQIDISTAA